MLDFQKNVKYDGQWVGQDWIEGPAIGYHGINKISVSLGKQTSSFNSRGLLELKLVKEEEEGIVSYKCFAQSDNLSKCSNNVKRTVLYQRIKR